MCLCVCIYVSLLFSADGANHDQSASEQSLVPENLNTNQGHLYYSMHAPAMITSLNLCRPKSFGMPQAADIFSNNQICY